MQFTEYHATTNGHYDWHIDSNEHEGKAYVRVTFTGFVH